MRPIRFWMFYFAWYCLFEAAFLLFGLGLLPRLLSGFLSGLICGTVFAAMMIESWQFSTPLKSEKRWLNIEFVEHGLGGMLYAIPMILAMISRVQPWLTIPSIMAFTCVLYRLNWLRSRCLC